MLARGGKQTLAVDQFGALECVVGPKFVETRVPFREAVQRLQRVLNVNGGYDGSMPKTGFFRRSSSARHRPISRLQMCLASDADFEPRLREIGEIVSTGSDYRPVSMVKLRVKSERRELQACAIHVGWRGVPRHHPIVDDDV